MFKNLKKRQSGFTIIEVLIVLAIAGLIMLVVFLAVPALQRNSRNSQRRSDAAHLAGLIGEFQANHNGASPAGFGAAAATQVNLANENFAIFAKPTTIGASYAAPSPAALDTAYVFANSVCNNNAPAAGGGTRSIIVVFYVEPGPTLQCVGQ